MRLLNDYYVTQLKKLGVKVELKQAVTPELINKIKPEAVIIATGSSPLVPDIPGITNEKVVTAIDVLLGRKKAGERVVVAGGGLVGCETAVYLAQNGRKVTVVEALEEIIPDVFEANKQYLFKMLAENGVSVLTNTSLVRISEHGAIVENRYQRFEAELKADTIILALGLKPEANILKALQGKVKELYSVGDCERPAKIIDAIWGAFDIARAL